MQLLAIEQNYDAIQYIKGPTKLAQMAAVKQNYQALRLIGEADFEAELLAVSMDDEAMRFVKELTKEKILAFARKNSLVLQYVQDLDVVTLPELEMVFREVLSEETVEEKYVRDFIRCSAIDAKIGTFKIDKIALVDRYGSKKAKKVTVDEKLRFH